MMTKVLVSAGFGAGWSTWNTQWDDCSTDAALVALVDEGLHASAKQYADEKWEGCYTGGLRDCYVVEVATGDYWRINEYDGSENLEILNIDNWNRG